MDAMAGDCPGTWVSHVSRIKRPCLARTVQSFPHRAARPSSDRAALCRTESSASESGPTWRRLAVVECPGVVRTRARSSRGSRTCGTPTALARLGERADGGDRRAAHPATRASRRAVRIRVVGDRHSGVVRTRCKPPADWAAAAVGGNVECPRSVAPNLIQRPPEVSDSE